MRSLIYTTNETLAEHHNAEDISHRRAADCCCREILETSENRFRTGRNYYCTTCRQLACEENYYTYLVKIDPQQQLVQSAILNAIQDLEEERGLKFEFLPNMVVVVEKLRVVNHHVMVFA